MVLNDTTRKNLKTWLEKSLANHHEDGLVAYIEALVGDADGADDDLLEKLTGRLDDFLAESSAEFAKLLLRCVRTGSFGQPWRGASARENVSRDGGDGNQSNVGNANCSTAEARDQPDYSEDAQNDAAEASRWVGQSGSIEENEDEEEVRERRSMRIRHREREREEREEADDRSRGIVNNGKDAEAASGSGNFSSNKRPRVQDGGRGNGGGESRGSGRGTNRVSGGRGQPGAPGSISPQNQNQLSGRGGTGMGSLATVVQPMGPSLQGATSWGPNVNGVIGPRGMPPAGFPPRGYSGPGGMTNNPMGGTPMAIGPHLGLGPGMVGGPRSSQRPRPGDGGEVFEGTQSQPRGSGGLLPTPYGGRGIAGQGAGRGGVALLPRPPVVNNGGTMAPRPGGRGMALLVPPGGFQGPRISPTGYMGPVGPVGFEGPRGPGGPIGPGEPTAPGGQVGPRPQGPGGLGGPVGPRGQIAPRGAGGPGGPGELEGPVGVGGPAGPRGPAGPWGTSGKDGSVNQGASVRPRVSLIPRDPSGARGHGGRGGGAASTSNGGLLDMQDNSAPMNRVRDGGPVLDRPPQGRHPDVGLGPGQQTFGGPGAGPEFLGERGGNGGGGSLRHGSQGSFNVPNARAGGGAFDGGDIQRGMGPGPRQASRQVLDDRPQPSGQQGPDAQVSRSGGMHTSEARGNMMHPSMEPRDGPREMQGIRLGSEMRDRNDGQPQISIRQGVSSRADLRHGIQESEIAMMRGGQDFRPSPPQRDGHVNMQGTTEMQGINRTGDKNGRNVFDRLGARPSPEAGGPREAPHLNMVAKRVRGSDLRQQGPETRDVSRDIQRPQNMGIEEDLQHRRDDVHHRESMDRSTTRGLAGEDDPREGSRGRQQAWHAPDTRVGVRGLGTAAHREEQTSASVPGRGMSPVRNQTFTLSDRDQGRAVSLRDRQQDGVDMGSGGPRMGSMPREVSPKHPGGPADVRHMNIGHTRVGSALHETMEQYDSRRAYDHGTRDTQVDFSSGPASGVGRNNIQMGSSSRDGASLRGPEVVDKRVAQVPSRRGVDAGPAFHGERGRPGADAMPFSSRPGGRIGGDGDEARFDVPTDGVRATGGGSAWGGIGMVKENNDSMRVGNRRVQISTRSGGSASLVGNRDDTRSGPDHPDQSEERSYVQGRRGNEDPSDDRFSSTQGDSSGRDWSALRGRREMERRDDGHEHPTKRKELTRVAEFSTLDADSRWIRRGQGNGDEHCRGNYEEKDVPRRQTGALPPSERMTVRCEKIPGEYGIAELKQHFIAFGEVVDIKLRLVLAEEGGNGEQEALVQFASADQAQACLASPKAVLGNRFIVVGQSPVNLHPVKNSYVDKKDLGVVSASESGHTVTEHEVQNKTKAMVAGAVLADRKSAHEQQVALASKTQDIVKQQLLVMQLREHMNSSTHNLDKIRENVEKLQGFLKMMDHKGKPEAEKDVYRKKLEVFSSKLRGHEAEIADLEHQSRILADLEKEARDMGATIPPPPNPALHTRTVGTARGVATDPVAGGGRGYPRGKGHNGPASTMAGRGGVGVSGPGANPMQDADPRLAFTLDNRPTAVKVTGMPESAGEADLRLYSDVFGVVLAATMLQTPGEGLVKFADRRTAEVFISKSRTFCGFPIRVSWYTEPFPDNTALDRPGKRMNPPLRISARTSAAAGGGRGGGGGGRGVARGGGAHVTSIAGRNRGGGRVETWHLGQRNAVGGAATAAQGAHHLEMYNTEESKAAR